MPSIGKGCSSLLFFGFSSSRAKDMFSSDIYMFSSDIKTEWLVGFINDVLKGCFEKRDDLSFSSQNHLCRKQKD